MTYKELFLLERPDWSQNDIDWVLENDCPSSFYKGAEFVGCNSDDCPSCWDREVPEKNPVFNYTSDKPIAKVTEVKYENGGVTVTAQKIKDSGDRTQFESGAVRDMREGKGRCDLMPLEVVSQYMEIVGMGDEGIVYNIAEFRKSGYTDTYCLYLALHEFCNDNYEKGFADMFLDVAKHFEDGAKKYGENNWQKGIPAHCYIDSALRHYFKWLRGDDDEPHDRAFIWNLMCCIWEVDYHKEDE